MVCDLSTFSVVLTWCRCIIPIVVAPVGISIVLSMVHESAWGNTKRGPPKYLGLEYVNPQLARGGCLTRRIAFEGTVTIVGIPQAIVAGDMVISTEAFSLEAYRPPNLFIHHRVSDTIQFSGVECNSFGRIEFEGVLSGAGENEMNKHQVMVEIRLPQGLSRTEAFTMAELDRLFLRGR